MTNRLTQADMKKNLGVVQAVYPMPVLMVADFFGIASGNTMEDKLERTGYHTAKSEFVNAPVIEEFPVVMECELAEVSETESFYAIVGK